jgi:ubiquinone/menaquinone biosynthesis C-methylase UbiE
MPVAILTDKLTDDLQSWDIKWSRDAENVLSSHTRRNNADESTSYLDEFFSKIQNEEDVCAIDIGCGNGRHVLKFNNTFDGRFIGSDFSLNGLRTIRAIDGSADLSVADATRLPFKNGVFDVVLMVGVVYEIEDIEKHQAVFCEINRVLKTQGICIFVSNSHLHFLERLYSFFPKYNSMVRRALGKPPVSEENVKVWHYRLTNADVKKYAYYAQFRIEGPKYCNVKSGIGRTWDMILVTGKSYENDIHFKENILIKILGYSLLAIGSLFPGIAARTAVYFLHKKS